MKKEIIKNAEYNFEVVLFISEEGKCYCPVCGITMRNKEFRPYDSIGNPSYEICSCGFQFGHDDGDFPGPYDKSWENYRNKWLVRKNTRPPFLTLMEKKEQLKNIGLMMT